jgi:hypothetical protein
MSNSGTARSGVLATACDMTPVASRVTIKMTSEIEMVALLLTLASPARQLAGSM